MADHRRISDYYAELARQVIEERDDLDYVNEVTVIYLSSNNKKVSKGKRVFAQCEKVADKNKWAIPADFTITVFDRNCEGMTEEQLKILLHHEMLHIGVDVDDRSKLFIRPHDLEDFKEIIEEYGTNWSFVPESF